ncbi:CaiB/BaiF CoA transferase family protein [Pedococcus sp. NPDC057267]|uniref:CaiB/BaiF CoA transferase family protein n=1 Tax=Pedococcus sp. NPDC057267 TaxID=3346077 RepID=UPI00363F8DD4
MSAPGPLDGVVVADFSRVLAGPYATMLLADLGATVVKVESPTGDDTRHWGPPWTPDGHSTYYQSINRNKRSVVLDLSSEEGRRRGLALVRRADVLIENFRTGSLERLGFDDATLSELNPRLVHCSITGFGAGAGAGVPGYDLVVQAVSGLMSLTGPDAATPTKTGIATADVLTGLHAAIGILAALRHRDATGVGQRVELNLLSSMLSGLVNFGGAYALTGDLSHGMGIRHPSICPYEEFETADRLLVVAAGNDRQFRALCGCLGLTGLADDPRFATNAQRVAHRGELKARITAVLRTRSADEWFAALTPAGVPCGPLNDVGQGMALAEQLGLEPIVDVDGSAQVANPLRFSATPVSYRRPPPGLGGDEEEVLAWLDHDEEPT